MLIVKQKKQLGKCGTTRCAMVTVCHKTWRQIQ